MEESCGNCRFFRRIRIGQAGGVCRAKPPVPMLIGAQSNPHTNEQFPIINTYWPQIPDTEWCGEYARRVVPQVDLSKLSLEELGGAA